MWSSRIFWRMLAVYLALNLGLLAVILSVALVWQRRSTEQAAYDRLNDAVVILQTLLRDRPQATAGQLQRHLNRISDRTRLSVTVMSGDGTVLATAPQSGADRERQLERPEIVAAASQGVGRSLRVEPTTGQETWFYAGRVKGPGDSARFVRASLSVDAARGDGGRRRWLLALVVLLVSTATAAVTYALAARIRRPVVTMTRAAHAIAAGDFDQRLDITADELGHMSHALNQISRQQGERMTQLQQNSDRLETVLRGMAEGVIAVDARQRILLVNDAAERFLRLDAANLVGRPLLEAIRNNTLFESAQAAIAGDAAAEVEFDIESDPVRTVAALATRLPGQPCPGVVLVLRDVTRIKHLENLRRDFVANVSHELKTPLASIKAVAETLAEGAVNDPDHNLVFVGRIQQQADRLHQLILDLLSLARIESGRSVFEIEDLPMAAVVAACVASRESVAREKAVTISVAESDESLCVRADAEALKQIVGNLVDNALNYTPSGGAVTVGWVERDGMVELEVSDTGVGIDAANHERVFERFYRVDTARSRAVGGTGLGLSIVKHLAESFGGSVSVESQLGSGATFRVQLPQA